MRLALHSTSGLRAAVKIVDKTRLSQVREAADDRPLGNQRQAALDQKLRWLRKEVILMGILDHPHIVRLYDVWESPDYMCVVQHSSSS